MRVEGYFNDETDTGDIKVRCLQIPKKEDVRFIESNYLQVSAVIIAEKEMRSSASHAGLFWQTAVSV